MAITTYFGDEGGTVDGGDGSIGNPYGPTSGGVNVLERMLDTLVTRDATNGDKLCLKSGTTITLSKNFDVSTYGTPTATARLSIVGYTTTEDDGGQAAFDGNALYGFSDSVLDYVDLIDLDISNTGTTSPVRLDRYCTILGCKLTVANARGVWTGLLSYVADCEIYVNNTVSNQIGIYLSGESCVCARNWISLAGSADAQGIYINGTKSFCVGNIITTTGTSAHTGINSYNSQQNVFGNSVYSAGASTGQGIHVFGAAREGLEVSNNLIEGFSGAGGDGIDYGSHTDPLVFSAGNAFYNNTANETAVGDIVYTRDNESLGSSPFAKSGANTFANRMTFFAPQDVGNVLSGSWNGNFKGAVAPAAGGGAARVKRMQTVS